MLNTEYKTIYYTHKDENVSQWLEDISFATDMNYIKWSQQWDSVLQQWFYTSSDADFGETYVLYYEPSTLGCVFQLTNEVDERNYEIDDIHYSDDLKKLREKVMIQINSAKNKDEDIKYSPSDSKAVKQEKAKKQLEKVDGSRNSERL